APVFPATHLRWYAAGVACRAGPHGARAEGGVCRAAARRRNRNPPAPENRAPRLDPADRGSSRWRARRRPPARGRPGTPPNDRVYEGKTSNRGCRVLATRSAAARTAGCAVRSQLSRLARSRSLAIEVRLEQLEV